MGPRVLHTQCDPSHMSTHQATALSPRVDSHVWTLAWILSVNLIFRMSRAWIRACQACHLWPGQVNRQ